MSKLVLMDGQSIIYKMYYMIEEGKETDNAVYGFLTLFLENMKREQPGHLAVLFEKETLGLSKNLVRQIEKCKTLLKTAGVFLVSGDCIRNMVHTCLLQEPAYETVHILTADEWMLSFVSEKVSVELFEMEKEKGHFAKFTPDVIKEKYAVEPIQLPDVFSLAGDRAYERAGAAGIGIHTACELIAEFGTLDKMYEQLETIDKQWKKEALLVGKEQVMQNKTIFVTQKEEISFVEDCELTPDTLKQLEEAFQDLHVRTGNVKPKKKKKTLNYQTIAVKTTADMEHIFQEASQTGKAAFRLLTAEDDSSMRSMENGQMFLTVGEPKSLFALFLCYDEKKLYVMEATDALTRESILSELHRLLRAEKMSVSCFSEKENYGQLFEEAESETLSAEKLTAGLFDCNIAAYLLNPLISEYKVSMLAKEYLDMELADWTTVFGKKDVQTAYAENKDSWIDFYAKETMALFMLQPELEKKLQETGMMKLFREMEMPLSYVLFDMEREGILVKPDELKAYGEALTDRLSELEALIYEEAGEHFNINSPRQLGEILFEKMQIPGGKKTKTGYSTAAEVLEKLAPEYPFVNHILEYRGLAKLKSTYADGLSAFIGEDKRIHTHFNQTITATGRLSSTEPNLQNIPMRMELGRRIRKVFVPKDGCVFMDADYSQIELRVLAHMSQDRQLIEAYQMDEDIHRITASKVFHTPLDEVTDLQRRNAKAVNFGIVYGISSFGLSQDLSISMKEAKGYIDEYFKTYPGIKQFLDKTVEDTKEKGYCTSMFGRRRPVPELKSTNHMQKSFGERIAMNSPIQGTAADLIKLAMLHVYDALKEAGLKSKLILQIHDELLIETKLEETEAVREILSREMKNVCDMAVSLEIDLHTGSDWYEAK